MEEEVHWFHLKLRTETYIRVYKVDIEFTWATSLNGTAELWTIMQTHRRYAWQKEQIIWHNFSIFLVIELKWENFAIIW